jgi:adenylate kinase family enzyme
VEEEMTEQKTIFILNGPPSSGKGVWGKILRTLLSVPIIGVGDLLREAQILGILSPQISAAMDAGYLLDSESIWKFLQPALSKVCGKSFILDGYPRKPEQVEKIISWCYENNYAIRYLNLEQSREKTAFRLNLRKNIKTGTNLVVRKDDAPESVVVRYNEFEKYTRSVSDMFMENHPKNFAMITLNCDEIGYISKFLVGIFDSCPDDQSKRIQEELANLVS